MSKQMPARIYPLFTLAACLIVACSIGCRAGQQGGFAQPNFNQLGSRVGNIAVDRVINAGITRAIGGL